MNRDDTATENATLLEFAKEHLNAGSLVAHRGTSVEAPVAMLPAGLRLTSLKPFLDEYLPRPERVRGTAKLSTLSGFVDHVARFARPESAIFADVEARKLTALYDYHCATDLAEASAGAAGWCQHRAEYAFPVSSAWKAWTAIDGKAMDQAALASFIEDHAHEVLDAGEAGASEAAESLRRLDLRPGTPAQVLTLSRGLELTSTATIKQSSKLATGETRLVFEEKVGGENGAPLDVPGGFVVSVPVFDGDAPFALPVRLRLKAKEGRISYTLVLLGADDARREAFDAAIEDVRKKTALPVFEGSPE